MNGIRQRPLFSILASFKRGDTAKPKVNEGLGRSGGFFSRIVRNWLDFASA
jgi:hypothetical protein